MVLVVKDAIRQTEGQTKEDCRGEKEHRWQRIWNKMAPKINKMDEGNV